MKSSIIISVYKDLSALRLILDSLNEQTITDFETIVSEDGNNVDIKAYVKELSVEHENITHLSQEDLGFRKNIALNKAINATNTDHIIFIDGDCVLHPGFIAAHQSSSGPGIACTGRRLELGEVFSEKLRNKKFNLHRLTNRLYYFLNIPTLSTGKAKNIESGIYSKRLQSMTCNREIRLLGCNFSCNKNDLVNINGFNEDYLSPGIGEDSDIDWRLLYANVVIKNVKFSAIQYHLYHQRSYVVSDKNIEIFSETKEAGQYICSHGLINHDLQSRR